jgi:hypothetical protein
MGSGMAGTTDISGIIAFYFLDFSGIECPCHLWEIQNNWQIEKCHS